MAEQLSLFDAPKPVYTPAPPDLNMIYKFLFSKLQRLRFARCMPWSVDEIKWISSVFDEFCPMYEHEGPQMLADYRELIARLAHTVRADESTWLEDDGCGNPVVPKWQITDLTD